MLTLGDKTQAHVETFLAKDDEEIRFDARIGTALQPFNLLFTAPEDKENSGGDWENKDGVVYVRFRGWGNIFGSMVGRTRIGDLDGKPIWFSLAHHRVGNLNLVHFYVLIGGSNE